MIAAAVDKRPADVLPKLMYSQDQPTKPDIAVVALQLFTPTLFLSLLLLALMMFLHASAATTVPADTSTVTTVPADTSTVPAAITADDPATVPAAISGDATTADVPGTDPGATNFADVPGTDPGATTFDVPRPGALRENNVFQFDTISELFMNMKDHEIVQPL
ncbi:hypothetical protein EMCRGX_G002241 [Ephydatia muelleri]